jgi:hypothetical protein
MCFGDIAAAAVPDAAAARLGQPEGRHEGATGCQVRCVS